MLSVGGYGAENVLDGGRPGDKSTGALTEGGSAKLCDSIQSEREVSHTSRVGGNRLNSRLLSLRTNYSKVAVMVVCKVCSCKLARLQAAGISRSNRLH
jgi:hypothetical protein